jgi:hypothetical protein
LQYMERGMRERDRETERETQRVQGGKIAKYVTIVNAIWNNREWKVI